MHKRIVRYVCCVPALTPTNPLFVKTGVLKLSDVFKMHVYKLLQNNMTGFDVVHKSFIQSQKKRFSKSLNFITRRSRSRLSLNFFRYLSLKYLFKFPEIKKIKNYKKMKLNALIKLFYYLGTRSKAGVLLVICLSIMFYFVLLLCICV